MRKQTHEKSGFTLIEVIISLVIIGIGVLAISNAMQYATRNMSMLRSQVIATNLAREGVEMVFNKRDTNWQMYPSKKDKCWLVNSNDPTSTTCETLPWMSEGLWTITTTPEGIKDLGNTQYTIDSNFWKKGFNPKITNTLRDIKLCNIDSSRFNGGSSNSFEIVKALSYPDPNNDYNNDKKQKGQTQYYETVDITQLIKNFFDTNKSFTPTPLERSIYVNQSRYTGPKTAPIPLPERIYPDPNQGWVKLLEITYKRDGVIYNKIYREYDGVINPINIKKTTEGCTQKYGEFYRYIYVDGLYNKLNGQKITCSDGSSSLSVCGDSTPKELRFCSIVDYALDNNWRRIKLCSVLNNFK